MTERLKTRFLKRWTGANVFRNLKGVHKNEMSKQIDRLKERR